MTRFTLILLLLAYPFILISSPKWTEREASLYEDCRNAIKMRSFGNLVSNATKLKKEASRNGNLPAMHLGIALRMRGNISRHHDASNKNAADSLEKALRTDYGKDSGNRSPQVAYHIHSSLAFYYLYEDIDYSKASDHAFKALGIAKEMHSDIMEADALNTITAIYAIKGLPEGIEYARKSEKISRTTGNLSGQYTALVNLANYLYNEHRYKESLDYLNKAYIIAKELDLKSEFTYIYSFFGDIWVMAEDNAKAEDYFRKSIKAGNDATYYDTGYALLRYSLFSAEKGNYSKALDLALDADKILQGHRDVNYRRYLLLHIAELYERMGRFQEALATYKRYSDLNSRLITAEKEKAFSIIELKYRISEHENKEKQMMLDNAARQKRFVVILFLCIVLTLIALFMIFMHYRNKKYYRGIIDANMRSLEKENEEKNRLLEKIWKQETAEAGKKTEKLIDELYGRLLLLMDKEKPYTDSTLSIEKTAAMLNTNRTYLSQVINSRTGSSYSVFINKARINEAV